MLKINYNNLKKKILYDGIFFLIIFWLMRGSFYQNIAKRQEFFVINAIIIFLRILFIYGTIDLGKRLIQDFKKVYSYLILERRGTLIKGLKYTLIESDYEITTGGTDSDGVWHGPEKKLIFYKAKVECILPDGDTIILESEPLFDKRNNDYPEKIDILIDLDDLSNYYVGFDIPENNLKEKTNEKI